MRVATLFLLTLLASTSWADQRAAQPNIVMIISDDQAWTDYSFMGHEVIQTPHLDKLARESATFRRGYVPTALCRPSLATMITGLYPHQHRITGNDPTRPAGLQGRKATRDPQYMAKCQELISNIDRVDTLPRLLAKQDYLSFQTGKWWEGPATRGGFTSGMTHGDPKRGGRHGDLGLSIGREGMDPLFKFIESTEGKPFFIWHAPFLPHTPHNPPERILKKYQAEGRPIQLAKYYAMCDWFDETCGQLLDYLDKHNLRDNTMVIYVTDNGWIQRTPKTNLPTNWRSSFAPRSKQSPNEGGVRTPIMIRWPGHTVAGDYPELVSSIDLMPTILDAAGLQVPEHLPGMSLLETCRGNGLKRTAIYGESFAHDIADLNDPDASLLFRWVNDGRWKLIQRYPGKMGRYAFAFRFAGAEQQLYDLADDPHETDDLAEENPEIVKRLRAMIAKEFQEK